MATTLTALTHHQKQRHDCSSISSTCNNQTARGDRPTSFNNKHSKIHVTNNISLPTNNNQHSKNVGDVSIETNCKNSSPSQQKQRREDYVASSSALSSSSSDSSLNVDQTRSDSRPTTSAYTNNNNDSAAHNQQQHNVQIAQARAPTPRMHGGIPLPVVPQPSTNQQFNFASAKVGNTNFQAQIAQQLLLARVVPQLMLPTQNYCAPTAGSPFSYLIANQHQQSVAAAFSPFHSPNMSSHNLQNSPQSFIGADRISSSELKNYMNRNSSVPNGSAMSPMTSPKHIPVNRSHSAMMSPEEVEQRIARLISENEAILEPSPVLLKRRSYIRQPHNSLDASTSAANIGVGQNYGRSLTNGRGLRSQSLIETTTKCLTSVETSSNRTSLAAMNFHAQVQNATLESMNKLYSCKFCKVGIRHLEDLRRHEDKCGRREEDAAVYNLVCQQVTPETSLDEMKADQPFITSPTMQKPLLVRSLTLKEGENKHPLKKRILAAAEMDAKNVQTCSESFSNAVSVLTTNPNKISSISCQKSALNATEMNFNRQISSVFVPKLTLTSSEQNLSFHPYCVTVKVSGATSYEPVRTVGRKPSQVTQPTFTASMRKLRPMHVSLDKIDSKYSAYSSWNQIQVPPIDSKLNIIMMDGYSMKAKRHTLKYVMAQKDLNVMRVTHSSYWLYSKKNSNKSINSDEISTSEMNSSIDVVTIGNEIPLKSPHEEISTNSCKNSSKRKIRSNNFITKSKRLKLKIRRNLSNDSQNDLEETIPDIESDQTLTEDDGVSDDETAEKIWQHDTNSISELRRQRNAHKNVWNRIKMGVYTGRNHRTPPPLSGDTDDDRCDSAPPALIGEKNVEFLSSMMTNGGRFNAKTTSTIDEKNVLANVVSSTFVEGKVRCDICSKEFVKIGLLRLHMDVHRLEQTCRRYDYKCPNCNSYFRSKNLLEKHFMHAHPDQKTTLICLRSTSSTTVSTRQTLSAVVQQLSPTTSKPRPFECTDCCVAFRIHGHLAKHLRSKSHIMKLESLDKLPIGIYAKLEENVDYFTEIDTSDCRNSLKSLLTLVERLMSTSDSSESIEIDKSIVCADLWIPPKVIDDELDSNRSKTSPSLKNDEKNNNECISLVDNRNTESRCKFCSVDFLTSIELKIHWHADHVLMRDGNYFKCPKKGCDKIYPSKNSLRIHLSAHFYGHLNDAGVADDVALVALSKKNGAAFRSSSDPTKPRSRIQLITKLARDSSSCSTDHSPVSESDSSLASRSVSPDDESKQILKRKSSEDIVNFAPSTKYRAINEINEESLIVRRSSLAETTKLNNCSSKIDNYSSNIDNCSSKINNCSPKIDDASPKLVNSSTNFAVEQHQSTAHQKMFAGQGLPIAWNPFNCSPQSLYLAAAASNPAYHLLNLHQQNQKLFSGQCLPTNFYNFINHQNFAPMQNGHLAYGTQQLIQDQQATMFLADQLRCILCQKQCSTPMSLQEHLMSHNPQSRLHVCKYCDAGFTTARALLAHLPCREESKSQF